jgi:hypothetical protein
VRIARNCLLPPSVEDWVRPGYPARVIRDSVDALDVKALGFIVPEAPEG